MKRARQLRSLIAHAAPHVRADTPEGDFARQQLPTWRAELATIEPTRWRDPLGSDQGPGLNIDID